MTLPKVPPDPGSSADRKTPIKEKSDFLTVRTRRNEFFPEEFPEGPYGAPDMELAEETRPPAPGKTSRGAKAHLEGGYPAGE